ncbi:hypothetical protein I6H07_10770 [Hafnia alvei]|uniref:hypothetical protein n=1 Tax=Hafnia alvei TaxID=569 RepID=UPI000B6D8153|nr:hypothetical protein [Hafnia alvei]MBI0276281.1 hypothetical protein [Hafnia alvei]PNK97182.1 hypothetical protein CEQ28_005980 [Hafnia alvei]
MNQYEESYENAPITRTEYNNILQDRLNRLVMECENELTKLKQEGISNMGFKTYDDGTNVLFSYIEKINILNEKMKISQNEINDHVHDVMHGGMKYN